MRALCLDQGINHQIHAQWGAWIVLTLALLFVGTAVVPSFGMPRWLDTFGKGAARFLSPVGRALSFADSILVYCVAPAAGSTLRRRWLGRYGYLAAYMIPLGTMGYFLPPPLGLIPIAWALIVAISISRRWAWVEDDRETAMLTAQFRSENLRVGFDQDLRDEALLAFSTMFILVPMALRQAHDWGELNGLMVFEIANVSTDNLFHWIAFFGAELAKAVPFVDWAEIYDVEGAGPIEMGSSASQHLVFGTRVLVDLVFLATLLQVLSTFARNSKQIEMFREGALDRFDPFIERQQFQTIVVWNEHKWVKRSPEFEGFGTNQKYSLTRLLELKEDRQNAHGRADERSVDAAVWAAAELLYDRDYLNADLAIELHGQLRQVSGVDRGGPPNKDKVAGFLDELGKPDRLTQIDELDDVRRHLTQYATAWPLRQKIIQLVAKTEDDPSSDDYPLRINLLVSALEGKTRDARAPNRELAFEALRSAYLRGESVAVNALQRAAISDPAPNLRSKISGFVLDNPRHPAPPKDDSEPTA